jgi:hypothetical protein
VNKNGTWSTVFPGELTVPQMVKKYPAFYWTRRFITAFTTSRHLSLSWAITIQSMLFQATSWRSPPPSKRMTQGIYVIRLHNVELFPQGYLYPS